MNDGMSVARRTAAPAKAGQVLWLTVGVALLLIVVAAAALLSISRELNASRASYTDVLHTRATLDQLRVVFSSLQELRPARRVTSLRGTKRPSHRTTRRRALARRPAGSADAVGCGGREPADCEGTRRARACAAFIHERCDHRAPFAGWRCRAGAASWWCRQASDGCRALQHAAAGGLAAEADRSAAGCSMPSAPYCRTCAAGAPVSCTWRTTSR